MNKFKSILLGSLLAATSITAFSQNSHAAEVQRQHDNFNPDIIAFDNTQPLSEHQIREQRERGQRARELRERQSRKQQIRRGRNHQQQENREERREHDR
jgi:hypothetical protein